MRWKNHRLHVTSLFSQGRKYRAGCKCVLFPGKVKTKTKKNKTQIQDVLWILLTYDTVFELVRSVLLPFFSGMCLQTNPPARLLPEGFTVSINLYTLALSWLPSFPVATSVAMETLKTRQRHALQTICLWNEVTFCDLRPAVGSAVIDSEALSPDLLHRVSVIVKPRRGRDGRQITKCWHIVNALISFLWSTLIILVMKTLCSLYRHIMMI